MRNDLVEVWWTSDDEMWEIESHWLPEMLDGEIGRLEGFEFPPKTFLLNGVDVDPDCVMDSVIDELLDMATEEYYSTTST